MPKLQGRILSQDAVRYKSQLEEDDQVYMQTSNSSVLDYMWVNGVCRLHIIYIAPGQDFPSVCRGNNSRRRQKNYLAECKYREAQ